MTLAEARRAYRALRDRAVGVSPTEATYAHALWERWDEELTKWPPETELGAYVDHLTATIADPNLYADAVVEWLDAYPSAIVDRLPGGSLAVAS